MDRLRCLFSGHLWCWDIDHMDIYVRGGPIFTCARCGKRTESGLGKTIFLSCDDFEGLSRAAAQGRAA